MSLQSFFDAFKQQASSAERIALVLLHKVANERAQMSDIVANHPWVAQTIAAAEAAGVPVGAIEQDVVEAAHELLRLMGDSSPPPPVSTLGSIGAVVGDGMPRDPEVNVGAVDATTALDGKANDPPAPVPPEEPAAA